MQLSHLRPTNLAAEKAKFFAADFKYNPQFTYKKKFSLTDINAAYECNRQKLFAYAENYLTEARSETNQKSSVISFEEAAEQINQTCQQIGCPEPKMEIAENSLAPILIKGRTIVLDSKTVLTKQKLTGFLAHELETHYLRSLNQKQQPWPKSKDKFLWQLTEEGLANLNHAIAVGDNFYKTMQNYAFIGLAQRLSFAELFARIMETVKDPEKAWRIAARKKRGLEDTALAGGLLKDVIYLEGTLKTWQWLLDLKNDPRDLYWGKIAVEDIAKYRETAVKDGLYLPLFLSEIEQYRQKVINFGQKHDFNQIIKENLYE